MNHIFLWNVWIKEYFCIPEKMKKCKQDLKTLERTFCCRFSLRRVLEPFFSFGWIFLPQIEPEIIVFVSSKVKSTFSKPFSYPYILWCMEYIQMYGSYIVNVLYITIFCAKSSLSYFIFSSLLIFFVEVSIFFFIFWNKKKYFLNKLAIIWQISLPNDTIF